MFNIGTVFAYISVLNGSKERRGHLCFIVDLRLSMGNIYPYPKKTISSNLCVPANPLKQEVAMSVNMNHAVMLCYRRRTVRRLLMRLFLLTSMAVLVVLAYTSEASGEQYSLISYGEGAVEEPRYRTLGAQTGWSDELSALPVGGPIQWTILRACPERDEAILGVISGKGNLHVQVWNGSEWSNLMELVPDFPSSDTRFFDIAYESQSGNAIVVYGIPDSRSLCFRIWDGISWSEENTATLPGKGAHPQCWFVLVPDPYSNEIVLFSQSENKKLHASVWDGESWGNSLGDIDKTKGIENMSLGACRQGQSGNVVAAWIPDKGKNVKYIVWDGSGWTKKQKSGDLPDGVDGRMLEISPDPGSDRIMVGVGDTDGDVAVAVSSGFGFGGFQKVADNCRVVGKSKSWDLMYEGQSGNALLVYTDAGDNYLRYKTYGEDWSIEQTGPMLNDTINVLHVQRDAFGNGAVLLSLGETGHIESALWNGSYFSPPQELETDASNNLSEPFDVAYVEDFVPFVSVLSPNGGEAWGVGELHDIAWQISEPAYAESVNVYLSIDGGIIWQGLATGVKGDSSIEWEIPNAISDLCLVRVEAYRDGVPFSVDGSDGIFSIVDNTPPSVSVIFPNGGETFQAGDTCVISWTASDNVGVTDVNILFSTTGGYQWISIAMGETNNSEYEWIIPNIPSEMCLVKIQAFDAARNSSEDVSDSLFTIYDPTGVADDAQQGGAPEKFALFQNEPNPFHATTSVKLMTPGYGSINLSIYDCTGRLVYEVADEARPGVARLVWNGRDASGHLVPTGLYFYRLRAETSVGAFEATRKMAVLR